MDVSDGEFNTILAAAAWSRDGHRQMSFEAQRATWYGEAARLDFSATTFDELHKKLVAMKGKPLEVNEHEHALILAALRFTYNGMIAIADLKRKASDIAGANTNARSAAVLFVLQEKLERVRAA